MPEESRIRSRIGHVKLVGVVALVESLASRPGLPGSSQQPAILTSSKAEARHHIKLNS
jgi:hypothetical protein